MNPSARARAAIAAGAALRSALSPPVRLLGACAALLLLAACAGSQTHSTVRYQVLSLDADSLRRGGLALITPSTVTGQEEDKPALALIFADVFIARRDDVPLVRLSETLSVVNRAGMAVDYERMLGDARATGVLDREVMRQVARATGTRYLAHIKLAGFQQESLQRWSLLGVRMIETKRSSIRLFLQIWDSSDGSIAWEGTEELVYSMETSSDEVVTLRTVVEATAANLILGLPGSPPAGPAASPEAPERRRR